MARHLPDTWFELTDPTLPATMPGRERGDEKADQRPVTADRRRLAELSGSDPGDEGLPFVRVETQLRALRVFGVRHEHVPAWKLSDGDTIAIPRAKRTYSPLNICGCLISISPAIGTVHFLVPPSPSARAPTLAVDR